MPSALVYTSHPLAVLFYVVYGAWLLGELVGATILPRLLYGARGGKRRDRGSFIINVVTLVFAVGADFVLSGRGIALMPDIAYYLGIFLIVLGLIIRQWAIAVLGRFFTLTVKIQSDQLIVRNGPYRLVRHPSYSGLLLTLIGIGLALQTWIGLVLNIVVFALVFGYRISVEEKALTSAFGEKYQEYSRRTKRLIPYLI
jgi:protein-S-isoprenylcysteine O-methyltransferase Ste14